MIIEKKMVNNFNKFDWKFVEWEFYFIQIIRRKKDNPGVAGINWDNSARYIKEYSIYTREQLDKRIDEMTSIANVMNARIYIHPARRSIESVTKTMALLMGEHIWLGKHNLSWLYRHACWLNKGTEKRWVVDMDWDAQEEESLAQTKKFIQSLKWDAEIILTLKTKNWAHIITTSFDLNEFKKRYPNIDVHKNNPTLLYTP